MEFWKVVFAFVAANVLLTVVPIVCLIVVVFGIYVVSSSKQRKLLKTLRVKELRDHRYVSKARYKISLDQCIKAGHPLQNRPELATDGVFILRQFASTPEGVGRPRAEDGFVKYTLDQWCNEIDSFNAWSIMFSPDLLTKVE